MRNEVSKLMMIPPPRLLITGEKIRQIRERPDEIQREMVEALRGTPLNTPAPPMQTMVHDAVLWLILDDTEAAQRAVDTVRSVMQTEDSSVIGDGLGTARMGMAFDLLHGFLSDPDKAALRREIVEGIAGCATRHKAWFDARWQEIYHGRVSLDNHMTRGIYALISVGLALLQDVPEAKSWLEQGIAFLRRTLRAYPPDGSDIYAGTWFTLHYASVLMPMVFLRNVGLDLFPGQTALTNSIRFRQFCAVGKMLDHTAFNGDSHSHKVVGDAYLLYILASAYRHRHAQWLGHKLRALSRDPERIRGALPLYEGPPVEAFELACYDPTVPAECALADWPTAAYFPDTGEAILRGGWGPDDPVLWFCCAPVGGNYRDPDVSPIRWHAQPVAGAFEVFAGRAFVTEEPNPSTTRRTYVGNTLTVNGVGQMGEEVDHEIRIAMLEPGEVGIADIRRFHHGPGYDLVQGEAWRAYRPEAGLTGFTRTVVFIRPDVFVVHDDLRARTPSRLEWRLHTAGEIVALERQGESSTTPFLFRHEGGGVVADIAFPTDAVAEVTSSSYFPGYSGSFKRYRHLLVTPVSPVDVTAFLILLRPVGRYGRVRDYRMRPSEGTNFHGIVVEYGAGREIVLFTRESGRASLEGVEVEAEGCVVGLSHQGVPRRFLLWEGKELGYNGVSLFRSDVPVETVSFCVEESALWGSVRSHHQATLELSVQEGGELHINGETRVPLIQDGRKIIFSVQPGEQSVRVSGPPKKPHPTKVPIIASVWPNQGRVILDVEPNTFSTSQEVLISTVNGSERGWPVSARYFCGLRAPDKNSFEITRVGRVIPDGRIELSDGLLFYPAYTTDNGVYLSDNLIPDGDMAAEDVRSWFVSNESNVTVEKVKDRSPLRGLCLRVCTAPAERWVERSVFPHAVSGPVEGWVEQEIFGLEPGGTYRLTFSACLVRGIARVEYHDDGRPTCVPLPVGDWVHHAAEFRFMMHEDGASWVGIGRTRDSFLFRCRLEPGSELLLDAVTLQRR